MSAPASSGAGSHGAAAPKPRAAAASLGAAAGPPRQASAWDGELAVVASEIAALRAAHRRTRPTGAGGLAARQMEVLQLKLGLDRQLERLARASARELLLLPREKAMLHWARVYWQHAQEYLALRSTLLARSFWLKLVKTRLGGGAADAEGGDDLVALAVRQRNLAQTEAYLEGELATLTQRREALVARYEQRGVAEANLAASRSLQARLGATLADALANPTMRALASFLLAAAAPLCQPAQAAYRATLERRLASRTGGLMALCRNLAAQRVRNPAAKVSPRAMGRFNAAMEQLDELAAEAWQAHSHIMRAGNFVPPSASADRAEAAAPPADRPPAGARAPARPILVQNAAGPARTVPSISADQPGVPGL